MLGRLGGLPGGGRGTNWEERLSGAAGDPSERSGRGIRLFRDSGPDEDERDGASSPWRSDTDTPCRDSSSWERSAVAGEEEAGCGAMQR